MATDHAKTKVDPSITDLEALFAAACGWSDRPDLIQVCTGLHLVPFVRGWRQFALRNKFNDFATIPNCRQ